MEHYGSNFKTVNLDDILGPVVTENIFRNKSFLLTCTIPIAQSNGSSNERQVSVSTVVYDASAGRRRILGALNQPNRYAYNRRIILVWIRGFADLLFSIHEFVQNNNNYVYDLTNKSMAFSMVPFFKDHLKQQIESAGGVVYNNFEDVPKKKYRTCSLLAPFPCMTAKYVQCLAANITVSG